jgi:hypothetical protein
MKTLFKVEIEPVFVEEMPPVYEQGKVYISEKYMVSKHLCLCGCDTMVVMPFEMGRSDGQYFWGLVKENNGKVSFIGSVLQHPCEAHYIITKNVANFC